jgi:hypothetical protein
MKRQSRAPHLYWTGQQKWEEVKEQKKEEEHVWGFEDCINSSRPFQIVPVTLLYRSKIERRKASHLASSFCA